MSQNVEWVAPRCPLWPFKRRFDSGYEAVQALERTLVVSAKPQGLSVFRCQSTECGGYHIGHTTGRYPNGKRTG